MLKSYIFIFCFVLGGFSSHLISQEIKIFKVSDFDLKGNVKSCLVITKYGKEEYNFNEDGFLTKLVTRFSDADYDITSYKYANGFLLEKRLESYRDNAFDKNASIANIYTIDSLKNIKITEKIISYNKEFLDQYEYEYNFDNQLFKIVRSNNDGIDETKVLYSDNNGEKETSYLLNDVILKSIRTSINTIETDSVQKVVLTKKFIEGEPSTAIEQVYDTSNKLLVETKFSFNVSEKQFAVSEVNTFSYDQLQMMVSKKETKNSGKSTIKEFIYQFDNGDKGNWLKKIITPDNSYTTRIIKYYDAEDAPSEEE